MDRDGHHQTDPSKDTQHDSQTSFYGTREELIYRSQKFSRLLDEKYRYG